jgi:hypothetical protein
LSVTCGEVDNYLPGIIPEFWGKVTFSSRKNRSFGEQGVVTSYINGSVDVSLFQVIRLTQTLNGNKRMHVCNSLIIQISKIT